MKSVLLTALVLLGISTAHATSLNPCTPIIQAQPTHISCLENEIYYSITVSTLMSDMKRGCTGTNYYEYKTAKVEITKKDGTRIVALDLGNDDFAYTLGLENTSFTSQKSGLDLHQCVAPVHGAASIGN